MYGELPEIEPGKPAGYPVSVETPTSEKTCVLRLPTPDEFLTYMSAQRSQYRDLGKGQGESDEFPNPKADRALFTAIRLDKGGEEWDDAEVLYAVERIYKHKITDCVREGKQYVVTLRTVWGDTTHTVHVPFRKDLEEYRRNLVKSRNMGRGIREDRLNPLVACKFYGAVIVSVTGYAGANGTPDSILKSVPPHHKRSVASRLDDEMLALDPDLSPN